MRTDRKDFFHREHSDGTYDSICLRCFRTIGYRALELDLVLDEKNHICGKEDLEEGDSSTGGLHLV
jgi:hypothetical protein